MGGIFGVASKSSCVLDLFFGIDYHSHLGTRRGGMAVYDPAKGFDRAIHNIENSPFVQSLTETYQSFRAILELDAFLTMSLSLCWYVLILGILSITTVGKINNMEELVEHSF